MSRIRVVERRDDDRSYFFIGGLAAIGLTEGQVAEVRQWCADNFHPCAFTFDINMVWFEHDRDACAFKLMWM